jgi:hypothetical protein
VDMVIDPNNKENPKYHWYYTTNFDIQWDTFLSIVEVQVISTRNETIYLNVETELHGLLTSSPHTHTVTIFNNEGRAVSYLVDPGNRGKGVETRPSAA